MKQKEKKVLIEYLEKKPVSYNKALLKLKQVQKQQCEHFLPFQQYFSTQPITYLIPPSPSYLPKQSLQQKTQLLTSKQLQYVKGNIKDYVDDQFIESVLHEEDKVRGLMNNIRHKSTVSKDNMYYCFGNKVYKVSWQLQATNLTLNKKQQILSAKAQILELSTYYENYLLIRCKHHLIVLNKSNNQIVKEISEIAEITSLCTSFFDTHIYYNTYDGQINSFIEFNLENDQKTVLKSSTTRWPQISHLFLNRRQCLCFNQIGFSILDKKKSQTVQSYEINDLGNDHLYSAVGLWNKDCLKGEFAVCKRGSIMIFDIRNLSKQMKQIRHMCEQSPPSCLSFNEFDVPTLIAYSPYKLGSVLSLPLQPEEKQCFLNKQIYKRNEGFELLYDSGKMYKDLFPTSVTSLYKDNKIFIFQVDSCEGISLEVLQRNTFNNKYERINNKEINLDFNPSFDWFDQSIKEKYLKNSSLEEKIGDSSSQNEEDLGENELARRKVNYANLGNFYQKICQNEGKKGEEMQKQIGFSLQTGFGSLNEYDGGKYKVKGNKIDEETISGGLIKKLLQQWKI